MIRLTAVKRFINVGTMINKGESFTVKTDSLAQEFISRGLAKEAGTKEAIEATAEQAQEAGDFSSKTVPQLKELARAQGIEGYSSMKKDDLIKALESAK